MWTLICLLFFVSKALLEIAVSLLLRCCRSMREDLQITCIDDENNRALLSKCPSLKTYEAMWWASGPHAQTLLARYVKEEHKMDYQREMIDMHDGVQVAMDWKAVPYLPSDAPLIFICHGVGGDSSSNYLKTFTSYATHQGFRTVAYNRRGHGGTSLLPKGFDESISDPESGEGVKAQLFPRHYDPLDMEVALKHCKDKYPNAPIFGLGFSAGGNVIARHHCALGSDSPFTSAISMAHGYNIYSGISRLKQDNPYLLNGLICSLVRSIAEKNAKDIERLAKHQLQTIDLKGLLNSVDFMEVDIKGVVEPKPSQWGYASIKEYYDEASCASHLANTAKPLLCLASIDDPLVYSWLLSIPRDAARTNPNVIFASSQRGGHLGWLESREGTTFGSSPWLPRVACEYFTACLPPKTTDKLNDDAPQTDDPQAIPSKN
jgi:predicted alpha/beta-fold hydrolase